MEDFRGTFRVPSAKRPLPEAFRSHSPAHSFQIDLKFCVANKLAED